LGFLEEEDIDSTYVSPTLSVSSVLVQIWTINDAFINLLKTEERKKVEITIATIR
jgi:hypothetical protein